MVLGFTQPLTEMSTSIISWGIGVRCLSVHASNGIALHFYFVIIYLKIIKKLKHVLLNIEQVNAELVSKLFVYL